MTGLHALVTGANRGFGAAIARSLSAAGAAVTLLVRDRATAEAVAASLKGLSHIVIADVTDRAAVQRGCADAAAVLGPVEILVNNAGWVESVPFLKATPETFTEMINVHLMGAVHTSQAVLPAMVARQRGRIVNIASFAGLHGAPYVAHYVAAKHALVGLTRALALEFAPKGITVNAVCPGYSETDLVSGSIAKISAKTGRTHDEARALILKDAGQPRMVTPEEVANAVLAFAGRDASSRNGETLVLMGEDS